MYLVNVRKILVLGFILVSTSAYSQTWNWAAQIAAYSTGSLGGREVNGVTIDPNDNVLIVGDFGDSTSVGAFKLKSFGGTDMFVAKLNSTGSVLWAKSFGSTGYLEDAFDITNDPDGNAYICGQFVGNWDFGTFQEPHAGPTVAVIKYDANGNFVWARQIQQGVFGTKGSIVCAFNHIYAVADRALVKYTLDGDTVWTRIMPTNAAYDVEYEDVAVDIWGCVSVTGKMKGTVTYGSTVLSSSSINDPDILVVMYDANGVVEWARRAGAVKSSPGQDDFGRAITTSDHGDVYIVGQFLDSAIFDTDTIYSGASISGMFVAKYDNTGNLQWVKGGSSNSAGGLSYGEGVQTLANGDILIAAIYTINLTFADTTLFLSGGSDVVTFRLSADGVRRWGKRSDTQSPNNIPRTLNVNASKNTAYAGGFFYVPTTFGPSTLTIAGGIQDGFVAKMAISTVTAVREITDSPLPHSLSLSQNYPNPFNPTTTIEFQIPATTHAKVTVYNLLGQRVRDLVDQDLAAGSYATDWDGRDMTGQQVASGVYFYKLQAGSYVESRKMTLMK